VSYASYRAALLMEQLIQYEPDLFIIYSGHNEFLEERTYGDIKDIPEWVLRISTWAARSRAATLASNAIQSVASSWSEPPRKNELNNEVDTQMIGLSAYRRDDALQENVLKHYRYSLSRMIDIAHSVGARVVLITPASNLLGASPFKSENRAGLTENELARWNEQYQLAEQELGQGAPVEALAALDQAVKIDDRHATAHFRRGHALAQLGRYDEAKVALVRAMDEDVCPLRALSPMSEIVAQVATKRKIPLIDFVAIQEEHSQHGIPGDGVFLDHVHPTIEAHRLLALEILNVMASEGIANPDMDDATLLQVSSDVMSQIDPAAHGRALMNLSKVLGWAGKLREAYRLAVKAAELIPDSAAAQYQAGITAQLVGKLEESIDHYRMVIEIEPTAALAHGNLGVSLEARGDLAGAVRHYERSLKYGEPKDAERNQRNLARAQQKLRQSP
jgi:tetratricopeptide (TPR) repeat protein